MLQILLISLRLCWLAAKTKSMKMMLGLNLIFSFINGLCEFLFPLLLSLIVKALNEKNASEALSYFYFFTGTIILILVNRFWWRYSIETIIRPLTLSLRQIYFEKLFNKPYAWHLQNSVGYFSSALDRVCANLQGWLSRIPTEYLTSVILCLLFLGYSLTISFYLFLYFLCSLGIMFVIIRILFDNRIKYIDTYTKTNLKFNKTFIDFLYNIRSIKKMNLLNFTQNNLSQKAAKANTASVKMMQYNAYQWSFMEVFIYTTFLIPIFYFLHRYIQTGQGLEIIVMIIAIQPKMAHMGRMIMHFMTESSQVLSEYARLAEHLGEEKPIPLPIQKKHAAWKKIVFENTSFCFTKEGHTFKHHVPFFQINRGNHIAIVGKSGEGKTTFLNLLTNQFPLDSGKILVDDKSYNDLPQSFFDTHIMYISQDVELFDMTLYDNITMGADVAPAQLQKIIDGCCLNELIERMNGDLNIDIGEKGVKVSAGEKQRINLARGLLLDRDILVLDEITANLDPVTTDKIWNFIFTEYKNKTIIAISHEEKLLNYATRYLEFKKGIGQEILKK